jgi:gliding motility-associated-like protein
VTVNQTPAAPVVPNVNICQGKNGAILVQSPQAGYTYNWYTSSTGGTAVFTGPSFAQTNVTGNATYYVAATNGSCTSSVRTPVQLTMLPQPQANAGPDITIVAGDVVQLNGFGTAGSSYQWSPSTGLNTTNILNPMANPTNTTTYTLSVTHPLGCVATDDILVTVLPYCVKPMEAFTPNGDGINDFWKITDGNCIRSAKVGVFNRYGSPVYESDNYRDNWDGTYKGKPVPDGTYYFQISYQLANGKTVFQKGNVTILR